MTLSVCFIVRDEEEVICRALNSCAQFADEIIITDTGSKDKTVEIAKKFTDKVYFFEWIDDFSAARNFCFDKASGDYVMWMDADDIVSYDDAKKIRALVDGGGFDMAYLLYVSGEDESLSYVRERILRRDMGYRFSGIVHEAISPRGKAVYSDARIAHKKVKPRDPARNLSIYRRVLDERSLFYYGRELMFNRLYTESAAVLENFLTLNGWVENKIEACMNLRFVYAALGQNERAISCVLRSFLYAEPRAEACCHLGEYFMKNNNFKAAIYWYERALKCGDDPKSGAFVNADYLNFIPSMQLCVLYDRLGDFKKARDYNEAAGRQKPTNEAYLYNKRYFEKKLPDEVNNE